MRLIDADALIEEIRNKIPVYRGRNTFMSFVDDMPTAYVPEKVANCLEKASTLYSLSERDCEFAIRQDLALHIVRKGGIK